MVNPSSRALMVSFALVGLLIVSCDRKRTEGTAGPAPSPAANNRAGLVVVFGDGSVQTKCVPFSQASITGYELVQRSKIPFTAEFFAGQKSYAICSFEKEGCQSPGQKCFCQQNFWSYWLLQTTGWTSSMKGISLTTVKNGDVQGFRWGNGSAAPPPTSFKDICH